MLQFLPIIMMILSFFLAKKNGASTGKAALIAAGAGAATYGALKVTGNWPAGGFFGAASDASAISGNVAGQTNWANAASNAATAAADVATSWGPLGVAGVLHGGSIMDWAKENPWLAAGLILGGILILKE